MQAGHDQKFKVVQRVAPLLLVSTLGWCPVTMWQVVMENLRQVTCYEPENLTSKLMRWHKHKHVTTSDLLTFTPSQCDGVNVSMNYVGTTPRKLPQQVPTNAKNLSYHQFTKVTFPFLCHLNFFVCPFDVDTECHPLPTAIFRLLCHLNSLTCPMPNKDKFKLERF